MRAWRSRDLSQAIAARLSDEDPVTANRPRLGFVGAGRVGTTLAIAFHRAGWPIGGAASRSDDNRAEFRGRIPGATTVAAAAELLDLVDILFVTVPDDAIAAVVADLRLYSGQSIVHTSGLLPSTVLQPALAAGSAAGSFHPLVAFADTDRALEALPGSSVIVEGDERLLPELATLAESIGARPVRIDTAGKAAHHVAAVLAAGGAVGLLATMTQAARGAGLDEKGALATYLPLTRQALANAEALGIDRALTGPVARGDVGTLTEHLVVLDRLAPAALPAYIALSEAQLAIAERRGDLAPETLARVRALLANARQSGSM